MQLLDEAAAILTPFELRQLRKLAGWTLKTLSEQARISTAQLSMYENEKNGLHPHQVKDCEVVLLRAAAEREQMISRLFEKREAAAGVRQADPCADSLGRLLLEVFLASKLSIARQ